MFLHEQLCYFCSRSIPDSDVLELLIDATVLELLCSGTLPVLSHLTKFNVLELHQINNGTFLVVLEHTNKKCYGIILEKYQDFS